MSLRSDSTRGSRGTRPDSSNETSTSRGGGGHTALVARDERQPNVAVLARTRRRPGRGGAVGDGAAGAVGARAAGEPVAAMARFFSFLPTGHPRPAAPPTAPCAPGGRCARSHDRGHCLYFRSSLGECHTSCGTGGREYSRQAAPRPRNASRGPLRRDAPRLTGASGSGPTRCTGTRGPPSFGDCSRRTATC